MSAAARVEIGGEQYVIVPAAIYDKLTDLARAADLPGVPKPDKNGDYPAVQYARATLARKMIRERVAAGLTQRALAKLAGVRFETICRIERGRYSPSIETLNKVGRALQKLAKKASV